MPFLKRSAIAALLAAFTLAACVDRLPDQDMRILAATPVARLSADILWKEYLADRAKADRAYWGKPIVVSGTVTAVGSDVPTDRYVMFGQAEKLGVRANLLDEQAAGIMAAVPADKRLTLKCFCDGLSGNVVLKSCVKP
ncbi:MAG: hypothetical protein ABI051_14625 [Vicinamibacterales bacterium]